MQSVILLRDNPRSLALRPAVIGTGTPSVLVFEQLAEDYYHAADPRCTVKLARPYEFDLSKYNTPNSRPVFGCLGIIQVANEIFIAVVTDCQHIGRIRPGEEIYRIQSVSFYSLSSSTYDDLEMGYRNDSWEDDGGGGEQNPQVVQHPCLQLQKLFASGSFYFSPDFDLTKTVQARTFSPTLGVHSFDEHFLWNSFMIRELLNFRSKMNTADQVELDRGGFLVLAIQGYVGIEEPYVGSDRVELSVISKLSCKRAGTRYNTRGIDDNGHVANYVETETVLHTDQWTFAYTQVRGSVPVFWEQQGIQVMAHKIQISRGAEATQPAVERHFREQISRYGEVHAVNLLAQKENSPELALGAAYVKAVQALGNTIPLGMTNFDYHAECKGGNYENVALLTRKIAREFERFGYFLGDVEVELGGVLLRQQGVFRTNCVDCLDRTNMVQCELSRQALYIHLNSNLGADDSWRGRADEIFLRHQNLWAENGDGLSRIYAGTGALKSSVTRTGKVTLASVIGDATKSVNRFYINNFQDKAKQEVIDLLLGKLVHQKSIVIHDPVNDFVMEALTIRLKEYSTTSKITLFAGTYNLNGKSNKGESLAPWLLDISAGMPEPEIYAIGFQEIVELSPQQIMSTDVEKRLVWEYEIEKTLNSRRGPGSRYVLLRSDQLVGAALMVYAKENVVAQVRNVECAIKKTGMRGMAGNKGAVAIRMDYYDTSLCFVAAHLAAGHSAWEERNNDYRTISEGLFFARGRTIDSHDNVIWVSDLNYRIALSNEEVRAYVAEGNLATLLNADQLLNQMEARQVFVGYKEGDITFPPTYKYDNGADLYDSSEKQRIPAWTDRILYRGTGLRQITYTRAELYTSDHRPVMALFEVEITQMDKEARERIQKQLYLEKSKNRGALTATAASTATRLAPTPAPKTGTPTESRRAVVSVASEPMVVEDVLIDFGVDEVPDVDLPPPSSSSYKWWEEEDRDWFIDAIPSPLNSVGAKSQTKPTKNPFDQSSASFGSSSNNVLIDPYGEILDQPSEADEAVAWIPIQPLSATKKPPAPASRSRSASTRAFELAQPTNASSTAVTPIAATLTFDPPPNEQEPQGSGEEKVDAFAFWNEKQK